MLTEVVTYMKTYVLGEYAMQCFIKLTIVLQCCQLASPIWAGEAAKQDVPKEKSNMIDIVYSGLAAGALTYAQLAELPEGVLLQSDNLEFSSEDLKRVISQSAKALQKQLAKNAFLSREKTLTRKVKEYFLARRIEKVLPKKRILELYLNLVEWGKDVYGAETAARHYFNKPARALNLAEGALLAGMLPNPRYYNPFERPEKVREKQKWVLDLMLHNKVIDADEHRAALETPIALRKKPPRSRGPDCFEQILTAYLEKRLGAENLYRGGIMILTDLKSSTQEELERRFEKRPGGLLLVAREGDVVRAFICIGDTPPAVEPDLPFAVEVMSRSDFLKENLLGRPAPE